MRRRAARPASTNCCGPCRSALVRDGVCNEIDRPQGGPLQEACMTQPTIYGLPNCDTCKKARNWLARFERDYVFVDYRANPVPAAALKVWAQQLGGWEKLVNKAGTTWRNLLPQRKNPGSD